MAMERAISAGEDSTGLLDELAAPSPATTEPTERLEPVAPIRVRRDRQPAPAVDPTPPPRGRRARLRARQVERIVRRVRLWSVFRVAIVMYTCLWLVLVVAGTILWRVASGGGAVDNVESFMADLLAEDSFTIDGGTILRSAALTGVILVVAGTVLTVLLALLFNLVSEVTGGLRLAVVEMESAEPIPDAASSREDGDGLASPSTDPLA